MIATRWKRWGWRPDVLLEPRQRSEAPPAIGRYRTGRGRRILAKLHGGLRRQSGIAWDLPPAWPGLELEGLLEEHAKGALTDDLFKPEARRGAGPGDQDCEPEPV